VSFDNKHEDRKNMKYSRQSIVLTFLLLYLCVNTIHCVVVISSNSSQDVTFSFDNVYEITVPISINGTLTIEEGVTIKFHKGSSLTVYNGVNAMGAITSPITFTSANSAPAIGDWGGLVIYNSIASTSILQHVNFEYGGSGGCQVEYYGSRPLSIQDTTMKNIVQDGICLHSTGMCHNSMNIFYSPVDYRICNGQ
jgi:hypothetical protein